MPSKMVTVCWGNVSSILTTDINVAFGLCSVDAFISLKLKNKQYCNSQNYASHLTTTACSMFINGFNIKISRVTVRKKNSKNIAETCWENTTNVIITLGIITQFFQIIISVADAQSYPAPQKACEPVKQGATYFQLSFSHLLEFQ